MTVRILHGDCRDVLKTLPDASVHCCVTSPPYWGLRDYGVAGQIGLEHSVDAWVQEIVDVMREVRRVLRDDGTLWLNLGDSYAHSGGTGAQGASGQRAGRTFTADGRLKQKNAGGIKPKDLIGQPWLVAFALRADGWYLRQDIIWAKPNPMPESIRDRCTKAHEYVFLLSKSERYYYDFEAMQEPVSPNTHARLSQDVLNQIGSLRAHGGDGRDGRPMKAMGRRSGNKTPHPPVPGLPEHNNRSGLIGYDGRRERKLAEGDATKNNASFDAAMAVMPETRNRRSVWTIPSASFKEAHFATFPPALIEPCIAAGCPPGGVVLDPFGGAGTTGLVADRMQRDALLIELNPAYIEIARRRIAADAPLFADIQ